MHISRKPVVLEKEMSSFAKKSFINYDFHSLVLWSLKYEVEYMAWHSH